MSTFDVELMCPRCGTIFRAALERGSWVRCPECHLGVHVWRSMFPSSEKEEPTR